MAAQTTYTIGVRDLDQPSIVREISASCAAVLESGVLRAWIEPGTQTYFAPGMWAYMQQR